MKKIATLLFLFAGMSLLAPSAWSSDQVGLATSEDLEAFDAQLGKTVPPAPNARARESIRYSISVEAQKLKSEVKRTNDRRALQGQGVGNSDSAGTASGSSPGRSGSSHGLLKGKGNKPK